MHFNFLNKFYKSMNFESKQKSDLSLSRIFTIVTKFLLMKPNFVA